MVKYCPICGFQAADGNKFCKRCGTNLQMSQSSQPVYYQQTAVHQQQNDQVPQVVQDKPKKSKKMIIGLLVTIIAIIIVIALLFVFLFNGGSGEIEGTWQVTSTKVDGFELGLKPIITFNPNGTLSGDLMGSSSTGSWEVKNGKLFMYSSESGSIDYSDVGLDYSFSDPNTLTLTFSGVLPNSDDSPHTMEIVLKKIGSNDDNGNDNQNINGENARFLGTWNYDYSGYAGVMIFKSDGSLDVGYEGFTFNVGSWSLEGGQLCLSTTEDLFDTGTGETTQCVNYSFDDGDSTLTLTSDGEETIVLTK